MKSGKVLVVYFVTGLFHYFSGKLFNECTIKNYESVASQTEVLFYYYEFTEENFFLIHRAFYSKPQFVCCYKSLRKFDSTIKHVLLHKVYCMCDHIFFISSD